MVTNDKKNLASSNPITWMQDGLNALLNPSSEASPKSETEEAKHIGKDSAPRAKTKAEETQTSIDAFHQMSESTFVSLESLPNMGVFSVAVSNVVNQALPKVKITTNESKTNSENIDENSLSGQISLSQQAILQEQPNYHEAWKHLENAWMIFEEERTDPPTQETLAIASNILQQMAVLAPLAGRSSEFHQYVQSAEKMRSSIILEGNPQEAEEVSHFAYFLEDISRLAFNGEKNISQSEQEEAGFAKVWQHLNAGLGAFEAAFSPKGQLTALTNWRRATQMEWKGLQASIQNGELDPETALNLQNSFIEQGQAYAELLNSLIETKRAQLPPSYKTQRLGNDAIMIPIETPDSAEIKELIAMRQEVQKNLLQIKKLDFTDSKQVSKIAAAASRADYYLKQSQIKILEEKFTEVDSIPTTEGHTSLASLKNKIHKLGALYRDTLVSPENGNSYLAIWHQLDELKTGRQAIAQEEAIVATKGMFNLAHNLSLGSVGNSKTIEDLRALYKQIYNQWHDGDHLSKIRAESALNEVAESDHAKWYQRETQRAIAVNWLGNVGIIAASAGIGHAFSTGVVEFLEASGFVRGASLLKNIGFSANTLGFWYSHRAIQQGLMQEPFYPKGMTNAEKIYSSVEELIVTGVTLRVLGITQEKYYRMSPAIKKAEEAVLKRLETAAAKQGEIIIDESMLRGLVQKELELRPDLLDSYLGGSIIREMDAMTRVGVGESIYHSTVHQGESDPRQILKTALQNNLSPEGILNNGAMVLGLRTLNSGIAHNQSQLNAWIASAARGAGNKVKNSMNKLGGGDSFGDGMVLATPGGFQIKVGGGSFDSNSFGAHPRGKISPMEARAKEDPYDRFKIRVEEALQKFERAEGEENNEVKDALLDEVLAIFFVSSLSGFKENPRIGDQVRQWIEYQIGDAKELSPGLATRTWNFLTRKKTSRSLKDFIQTSERMLEYFNQKEADFARSTGLSESYGEESSILQNVLVIESMGTADKAAGLTGLEARFREVSNQHYQSLEHLAIEASEPGAPTGEAAQYHEALSKHQDIGNRYSQLSPEQRAATIIAIAKLYQAETLTRNETRSIEDFISQGTIVTRVFNHTYRRIVPLIDTESALLNDRRIQSKLPFLKELNQAEREEFIYIIMNRADPNLDSKREALTEADIQNFLQFLEKNSQNIRQLAKTIIVETYLKESKDRKVAGVDIHLGSRKEVAEMILNAIGENNGPLTEHFRERVEEYIETYTRELNGYGMAIAKHQEASALPSSFAQIALDPRSSLSAQDARALTELFPFQKRLENEIAKKQADHSSRGENGLSPDVIEKRHRPGRPSFVRVFTQYTRDVQAWVGRFENLQMALGSEPNLAKAVSPTNIKNNPRKARSVLLALDARLSSESGTPGLNGTEVTFGSGKNALKIQLQASADQSAFRTDATHNELNKLQRDIRHILQTFFSVQSSEPMDAHQLAQVPVFREAVDQLKTDSSNMKGFLLGARANGYDIYDICARLFIQQYGDIMEGTNTTPTLISPLTFFKKLESWKPSIKK